VDFQNRLAQGALVLGWNIRDESRRVTLPVS
jgi:hypothetical protein